MYNSNMTAMFDISFEWDPAKARSNESKHGVTFEEASSVFSDSYARIISARKATKTEERAYWRYCHES